MFVFVLLTHFICWCMEVFLTHRPLGASEKHPVNTQSLTRHFVDTRLCMQAFWDRCLSSDKQYCTADVQRQRWTEYLSLILMLKLSVLGSRTCMNQMNHFNTIAFEWKKSKVYQVVILKILLDVSFSYSTGYKSIDWFIEMLFACMYMEFTGVS